MDMRNIAVGVVMEVIATTMVPQVPDEEKASPTPVHDNTAIVVDCPDTGNPGTGSALDVSSQLRVTIADDRGLIFLAQPCQGPTAPVLRAPAGTGIAA